MFGIPVVIDVTIRVVGGLVAVGGCLYENRVDIWKKTHKREYAYLNGAFWCLSPINRFEDCAVMHCFDSTDLLMAYDKYAFELHTSKAYLIAPNEVKDEANQRLYRIYQDRKDDLERWGRK